MAPKSVPQLVQTTDTLVTGRPFVVLRPEADPTGLAVSPDGQTIVLAVSGALDEAEARRPAGWSVRMRSQLQPGSEQGVRAEAGPARAGA